MRETFSWKQPGRLMRTLLGPVYYNQFRAASAFMLVLTICLLIGPHFVSTFMESEMESGIGVEHPVVITNAGDIGARTVPDGKNGR